MSISWYVYLVKCKDNTLYTGISSNPDKRIRLHNLGLGAKYIVRSKRPVVLIYIEKTNNKSRAAKREIEIKSWSRSKKLQLISSDKNLLRNPL